MILEKHTEQTMTWMLAFRHCYQMRSHTLIPNVSWGLLQWEADFVAIGRYNYLTEVEIKVTKEDLLNDAKKYKHQLPRHDGWKLVKEFYYAVPEWLVSSVPESYRAYAGIISVPMDTRRKCEVIHRAPVNEAAEKLSDAQMYKANRLLGMRFWTNFKNKKMA